MTGGNAVSMSAVWRALRASAPPAITQDAYDYDRGHLHRLVRLERGTPAVAGDLWDYTQDVCYTEVQSDLLAYLLPICLQAWHDDLRGTSGYGGFVEHFYPMLANRGVFETRLTPIQTAVVSAFMRQTILDEIDDQYGLSYAGINARPYRWIWALTTHGVLLPDVGDLWTAWWALATPGRAVAALQYVSALMYADDANPIFAPWTCKEGGGPPNLWEFGGHLYAHRWQEPNVAFLRRTLTVSAVHDLLERAVVRLGGKPEHKAASRVLAELPDRRQMLAARCGELPDLLAQTQGTDLLHWSEAAG
jgi:hypothetical protein